MKILIIISLLTFLMNIVLLAYLIQDKYRTLGIGRKGGSQISFQLKPQEEACGAEDTEIPETELLVQRQE